MACLDWWNVQRPRLRYAASSSSACLLLMQIGLLSVGQHVLSNILSLKLSNSVGSCASENALHGPFVVCIAVAHMLPFFLMMQGLSYTCTAVSLLQNLFVDMRSAKC